MQNFRRNWPKENLGKLAIITFIYLLCPILKRLRPKEIFKVNHEIQNFEMFGKIGQNCWFFLTSGIEGNLHPLAKKLADSTPTHPGYIFILAAIT